MTPFNDPDVISPASRSTSSSPKPFVLCSFMLIYPPQFVDFLAQPDDEASDDNDSDHVYESEYSSSESDEDSD